GIKFGYAFPAGPIKMGNIIFYFWFVASLALLVFYIIRLWNKPVEIDE
ncbi:MAG: hypothetical protein H7178_09460, partial [Chitinophagaceae bacterium]|nr:hypothetical protein [Chitinophagaceae bacterium]